MNDMIETVEEFAVMNSIMCAVDHTLSADELTRVDDRYDATWATIRDYTPETSSEILQLLNVLLSQMELQSRNGEPCTELREKVLNLHQLKRTQIKMPNPAKKANVLEHCSA